MDPTPFRHRDLDNEAQEFLENWALEFPQDSRFRIIVHIAHWPQDDPTALVADAIHNYFDYKSVLVLRQLQLLLREGRITLMIGLGFLVLCLRGAELLAPVANSAGLRVLKDGLIIVGWVAMWQPIQIFLYGCWPPGLVFG